MIPWQPLNVLNRQHALNAQNLEMAWIKYFQDVIQCHLRLTTWQAVQQRLGYVADRYPKYKVQVESQLLQGLEINNTKPKAYRHLRTRKTENLTNTFNIRKKCFNYQKTKLFVTEKYQEQELLKEKLFITGNYQKKKKATEDSASRKGADRWKTRKYKDMFSSSFGCN